MCSDSVVLVVDDEQVLRPRLPIFRVGSKMLQLVPSSCSSGDRSEACLPKLCSSSSNLPLIFWGSADYCASDEQSIFREDKVSKLMIS